MARRRFVIQMRNNNGSWLNVTNGRSAVSTDDIYTAVIEKKTREMAIGKNVYRIFDIKANRPL